jgi:predicted transposase/invertase (TIGR01784 family)
MPVIVVAISKTNLFPKEVKCISYHRTREDETNQQHLFELTYVFIELGKFAKEEEDLNSIEDYWLYFLAKSQIAKKPPKAITDEMVLQAYKTIEQFNWSESEYDAYLRARLLAEAEELTLEKSYTDGKQEGIQLGKQKGKAERNIEIVENMLYQGIDIEIIAKSTGLTLEQIIALRDGNKPV